MKSFQVQDFMTKMPHTVNADLSLGRAEEMMREYGVRHLPVLHAGKVVGILSDRDVKLVSGFADAKTMPIEEAMTPDPYAVLPETPLKTVVEEMLKHRYGSALIVGPDARPTGIFTLSNALEVITKLLG